jgi:hypothetical protein
MYKSPSSVKGFLSVMKANKKLIFANAAVISSATLAGSLLTNDSNAVAVGLTLVFGGLPALALAQNASKLKNKFTEEFFPEKLKQQQQDVRERVDDLNTMYSKESILDVANDALDKNMISESNFVAIISNVGENNHSAISALDRLTEVFKAPVSAFKTETVKATLLDDNKNYETFAADVLDHQVKP